MSVSIMNIMYVMYISLMNYVYAIFINYFFQHKQKLIILKLLIKSYKINNIILI